MNKKRLLSITLFSTIILTFVCIQNVNAEKQPSDFYLEYLASARNADSPDDITSYWAGWMAESFKNGSDDMIKARIERIKESAENKKNITVVGTEKSGDHWIIELKSVYPDGMKMKGQVKIIQENGKYLIEEEYWTGDLD